MQAKANVAASLDNHDETVGDNLSEELWFGDINPGRTNSQAADSVAAAVAKASGLKPFPAVAAELMRMLANPDFDMREVKESVERDPALATRLLRVANSALFRSSAACDSIETAIVRLGAQTVGEIVAGVATMTMFSDEAGLGARMRDHCAGVAALARVLGTSWRLRGVPQLFLCGLLHDVGVMLSLQVGDFDYGSLTEEELENADLVHLKEREVLGYDHAVLGAHVLDLWKIPYPVSPVVAWHHQPGTAYKDSPQIGLMVAMLRLADKLEYQLNRSEALDDAYLEELIKIGACDFADISAGDLRMMWPHLVAARQDVFTMLKG